MNVIDKICDPDCSAGVDPDCGSPILLLIVIGGGFGAACIVAGCWFFVKKRKQAQK